MGAPGICLLNGSAWILSYRTGAPGFRRSKSDKRREVPPELLARVCAIIKAPPPAAAAVAVGGTPGAEAPAQAAYRIVRGRARPVSQA